MRLWSVLQNFNTQVREQGTMSRTQDRLAELLHRKPCASRMPRAFVRLTQGGLEVGPTGEETVASVRWSDVRRIIAYKHDLFGTDEICVGFLTAADADSWLEVSEEWSGFREAVNKMEELFPSIPKNWYGEVSVPPFERKETVLWDARSLYRTHR